METAVQALVDAVINPTLDFIVELLNLAGGSIGG